MGQFRAYNRASCSVNTAGEKLNASKLRNISPRMGRGAVPPSAPQGTDDKAGGDGDTLSETVVHDQPYRLHHDHHPQDGCGEVGGIA